MSGSKYFNIMVLRDYHTVAASKDLYWSLSTSWICGEKFEDARVERLCSTSGATVATVEDGFTWNEEKKKFFIEKDPFVNWGLALPELSVDAREYIQSGNRVVSDIPAPYFATHGSCCNRIVAKERVEEILKGFGFVFKPALSHSRFIFETLFLHLRQTPFFERDYAMLCGRCFCQVRSLMELHETSCSQKPELIKDMMEGHYFCPECLTILSTGKVHPKVCFKCLNRQHPDFDDII